MKRSTHYKKNFILVASLGLLTLSTSAVSAKLDIINPDEVYVDTSIRRDDVNYNLPTKIIVTPIYPTSQDSDLSSKDFYRGLYYYTIDKLGFNDIPFHYIVSEDGEVFKGNSGGDERRIKVEGIGDDIVLVGYITDSFSTTFSKKAINSLSELLTEVANKNSINPDKISVSGIRFIRNQSTKSVSMEAKDVYGGWNTDINEVKETVRANFTPKDRIYKVKIDEVKALSDNVKPGDVVEIQVKVSNLEATGLYGGSDSQIILTRVGENFSSFYLNGDWLSQTQVGIMNEEEILLPFQQATFTFKVKAPLYIGERKETFEMKTLGGTNIQTDYLEIALNMTKPDKPIVEILDTETGVLNVRSDASSVASVVTQVTPGERFFQLEDAGNGYIKIDLNDGTNGWVATRYVNYVSE